MVVGRRLLISGFLGAIALSLFGCGGDSEPDNGGCVDDRETTKTTDLKYLRRNFSIGGSLIVSADHLDYNISSPDSYADLDIVYFDTLLWKDNNFVDPETSNPMDEILKSHTCESPHHKRQHEIREVIENTNTIGTQYFMWSFSPDFGEDVPDLASATHRLAALVSKYGDGVNLQWTRDDNAHVFGQFLCTLHKAFKEQPVLASSKISVSGPIPSLWRPDNRPASAVESKTDGKLGDILKDKCQVVEPPETEVLKSADPTTADPTTADPSTADPTTTATPTTASPTTAAPTTAASTTAAPTTAAPTTSQPTPSPSPGPTPKPMGLGIDAVDWIEAEVYGLNARTIFKGVNKTPSGSGDRFYLNVEELNSAVSSLETFNKTKVRISFNTGLQSGAVWEGPKADLEIMYRLKRDNFAGVSFWGMNAFTPGGSKASMQSPCCLDPDVTHDPTFLKCGDKNAKYPRCVSESSWNVKACMWWQGDTPLNALWLINYFNSPIDTDDCPFDNTTFCVKPDLHVSKELVV